MRDLSVIVLFAMLLNFSCSSAQAGLLTGAVKGIGKGVKGVGKGAKTAVGGVGKGVKSTCGGIGKATKTVL
jgi:hypothetical protein